MKKKILIYLLITFFAVLLMFTFVSNSIYNASLPVVTTTKVKEGTLSKSISIEGELSFDGATQIIALDTWQITEVFVENGQKVSQGDRLFTIDISQYEVQRQSYELDLMKIEHSLLQLDAQDAIDKTIKQRSRKELSAQMTLTTLQLENLKKLYPADGEIVAQEDGVVDSIYVSEGEEIGRGKVCVSLHDPQATVLVTYCLPTKQAQNFQTLSNITVSFPSLIWNEESEQELLSTETKLAANHKKKLSFDGTQWEFQSTVAEIEGKPLINHSAEVTLSSVSDHYTNIVPSICVRDDATGTHLFIVKERESLFGKEYYVDKVPVEILYQNDLQVAVKSQEILTLYDIITTTTLPIYQGKSVLVQ